MWFPHKFDIVRQRTEQNRRSSEASLARTRDLQHAGLHLVVRQPLDGAVLHWCATWGCIDQLIGLSWVMRDRADAPEPSQPTHCLHVPAESIDRSQHTHRQTHAPCLSHSCSGLLPREYRMERKPDWKVLRNIFLKWWWWRWPLYCLALCLDAVVLVALPRLCFACLLPPVRWSWCVCHNQSIRSPSRPSQGRCSMHPIRLIRLDRRIDRSNC